MSDRYALLLQAVRGELALDARWRELAACAVAQLNGCEAEWSRHAPLLREAGASEAQLQALRDPLTACENASLFDATQRAVLRLALEMTRDVRVSESAMAAVRAALPGDRQARELVAAVAAGNMVTRLWVALGDGGPA